MFSAFRIEYFANPEWLLLLLLLPAYLAWYFLWFDPRRAVVRFSYDPHQLVKPKVDSTFLRHLPMLILLTGLSFVVLAMARPQTANEIRERNSKGIDIMLLIDTSASMENTDLKPNRLESAKETAIAFIGDRIPDRIGIVLFAQDAFSYAPLTLDHDLLQEMIHDISFNMLPKEGTAMGTAIATGINRLRGDKERARIMLLLTDGASNRGQIDPVTAARLAKKEDIRVYCIAIGKAGRIRRAGDETASPAGVPDARMLQTVARITGGKFYSAENESRLSAIFKEISQLERTEITEDLYREVADKYPAFLITGICMLLLAFLLMISFMYNPLEG
jgi:Ca-activated chloride channel family protein